MMVGQNNVGLIVSENEKSNGKNIETIKKIFYYNGDYQTRIAKIKNGYDIDESYQKLSSTSFTCKNNDKVQIIAFGGNRCTNDKLVSGLKDLVTKIFSQTTKTTPLNFEDKFNVTGVGYIGSPLEYDGAIVSKEYVEPLKRFTHRIFNLDGTIDDIRARASNTILFSHCVGSACADIVIESLIEELNQRQTPKETIQEILDSLLSINYASYHSNFGSANSYIPSVNLFQVGDVQNDGGKFMNLNDIYKGDKKKIQEIIARARKNNEVSLSNEIRKWNGMIMWSSENQNALNITLGKLKKAGKVHSPSELLYEEDNYTKLQCEFLNVFTSWFDDVVSGKHKSFNKVPILRHSLSSQGFGKRVYDEQGYEMM